MHCRSPVEGEALSICRFPKHRVGQTNLELSQVPRLVVHLNFKRIDLKKLRPLLRLLLAVGDRAGRGMQFPDKLRSCSENVCLQHEVVQDYLRQAIVLFAIEPEFRKLEVRLDRQALRGFGKKLDRCCLIGDGAPTSFFASSNASFVA